MTIHLTDDQKALLNAIDAVSIELEGDFGCTFELADELRILAERYGLTEIEAGIKELRATLEAENAR